MSLWLELVLRAAEGFNTSTMIANKDVLLSHEVFYKGQPTYHRVPWQEKTDHRMRPCFFFNFGFNNACGCYKMFYSHGTSLAPVMGTSDYPGPGGRGENCRTCTCPGVCA